MSRARDIANYGDGIDTSSITSGTFADARIAQSNVTQHESAIDALGTVASGTFNGTIGSSASFPSGKVLQVVDTAGTAKVDMAFGTGSGAVNITSLTITSSSQASYFYLSFSGVTFNTGSGHAVRKGIRIGTTSTGAEVEEYFTEYTHTDVRIKQPTFVQAKVTPSTSTAYTYYCSLFRDNTAGFYLNDNASADGTWMFKCIEVAQ